MDKLTDPLLTPKEVARHLRIPESTVYYWLGVAASLRLSQYPDAAPVIIDPRFGWGAPVVEATKVPVDAVVDLWSAGERLEDVAYEYGLSREQVEAICRVAVARAA
ncbi:DUF433 domain-containing protein [Actinophytocola sp.]|uniref:DUF433 domain-containing protein n=1 Tax=Actinophytocola sp. TaxID=1872138 RepID=UPI0025BAA8AF|nr:DUF433 domain-containing protein [Actinophytocola sp.]